MSYGFNYIDKRIFWQFHNQTFVWTLLVLISTTSVVRIQMKSKKAWCAFFNMISQHAFSNFSFENYNIPITKKGCNFTFDIMFFASSHEYYRKFWMLRKDSLNKKAFCWLYFQLQSVWCLIFWIFINLLTLQP